jgi:hypothetical protein
LENATCKRTLCPDGTVMEFVELFGSNEGPDSVTAEELDQWVASFIGAADGTGGRIAASLDSNRTSSRRSRVTRAFILASPPLGLLSEIVELLDRWGVVREPNESLAETFSRAIGWTPHQLRQELTRLERLESRFIPAGEPIVLQVVYISPDGSSREGPRIEVPAGPKGRHWRDSWRWNRNQNDYR